MNNDKYKGIFTALITPFTQDGQDIDLDTFSELVEWQIQQGIHGLVPCGTTGETATLNDEEYKSLIERCVDVAKGRVPIIAGTGSNSTAKTIAMTEYAKSAGVDAALVVAPYYNKPSQDSMIAHYAAISDACSLPIIAYNVPGRSVVNIDCETVSALAKLENLIGIKDATTDLSRPTKIRLACGKDFLQLSGEDATLAAHLAQGGHGAISVSSNFAPSLYASFYNSWMEGNITQFETIRDQLAPLADIMFSETSPAPIKYALSTIDKCKNSLRLPLQTVKQSTQERIDTVLLSLTKNELPLVEAASPLICGAS